MLGTFLVLISGGLLCQTLGWPYIFYIFGEFVHFENLRMFLYDSECWVSGMNVSLVI